MKSYLPIGEQAQLKKTLQLDNSHNKDWVNLPIKIMMKATWREEWDEEVVAQNDDSWSSIPWISGENPQETRLFRQEPAGKCQEFDAGIR